MKNCLVEKSASSCMCRLFSNHKVYTGVRVEQSWGFVGVSRAMVAKVF